MMLRTKSAVVKVDSGEDISSHEVPLDNLCLVDAGRLVREAQSAGELLRTVSEKLHQNASTRQAPI